MGGAFAILTTVLEESPVKDDVNGLILLAPMCRLSEGMGPSGCCRLPRMHHHLTCNTAPIQAFMMNMLSYIAPSLAVIPGGVDAKGIKCPERLAENRADPLVYQGL